MSTLSLTQNPLTNIASMWGGVRDVQVAHATLSAANVNGLGSLLEHFGVNAGHLETLGISPVNAKALLSAEGWRGSLNASKGLSQTLTAPGSALLDSVKNGWGSLEETMPSLSKASAGASRALKSAGGLVDGCKSALGVAKSGGFFGGIMKAVGGIGSSLAKVAGPIMEPLSKIAGPVVSAFKGVGNFMRAIPGLNWGFAAYDTFKAVTTLFSSKPWSEKLSMLGKAALSIGAALPLPTAPLLGGLRGAWAVGDGAAALLHHKK